MSWALVNADGSMAGAPTAAKPTPARGQSVERVPAGYPDTVAWSAAKRGWYDLMTEAQCLALVDSQAGTLIGAIVTIAPGRADLYRRKQAEVDKAKTLGGTTAAVLAALNLLTAAQRASVYPLLSLEMTAMGYATLGQAYTLVSGAIDAANTRLNAIEMTRRTTKQAIRAAATLAAKNAATTGVAWPT